MIAREGRHRAAHQLAVVLAAVLLTAGCGGSGQATGSPSPTTTPTQNALASCVDQLVYWAGENLRGAPDQAYDYQHMGLTSDQYDELRKIEKVARSLQAKGKLPPTWVRDRSREACTRILATPRPTNTDLGWP